jgi:hypothetical protein
MAHLQLIIEIIVLAGVAVIIPSLIRVIKISKEYNSVFDFSKIQAYIKLLDEKHITELELEKKKMGNTSLLNLVKMQQMKNKVMNDYSELLTDTTKFLRKLDVTDKDAFIKQHFPSHYDFFKITVLGTISEN